MKQNLIYIYVYTYLYISIMLPLLLIPSWQVSTQYRRQVQYQICQIYTRYIYIYAQLLDIVLVTSRFQMRSQDEIRQLVCLELCSTSSWCFQKQAKHKIFTNIDYNGPLPKRHILVQKRKNPAASPKRRKWGLGISIHIKMKFILINMTCIAIIIY